MAKMILLKKVREPAYNYDIGGNYHYFEITINGYKCDCGTEKDKGITYIGSFGKCYETHDYINPNLKYELIDFESPDYDDAVIRALPTNARYPQKPEPFTSFTIYDLKTIIKTLNKREVFLKRKAEELEKEFIGNTNKYNKNIYEHYRVTSELKTIVEVNKKVNILWLYNKEGVSIYTDALPEYNKINICDDE